MDTPTAKASWNANYGVVGSGDRRLAFSRQLSSNATTPRLARSDSSISMPIPVPLPSVYEGHKPSRKLLRLATASRPMRRLALLLALNVAYSATEFAIGLFTGRVGTSTRAPSLRLRHNSQVNGWILGLRRSIHCKHFCLYQQHAATATTSTTRSICFIYAAGWKRNSEQCALVLQA